MSDLRGLSAATSEEGSRTKHERLHRTAMPDLLYEESGKTVLATLKATALLAMFNAPQLEGVAQEVEDTIVKIMKEAASG
jgi:hypothetical protein